MLRIGFCLKKYEKMPFQVILSFCQENCTDKGRFLYFNKVTIWFEHFINTNDYDPKQYKKLPGDILYMTF